MRRKVGLFLVCGLVLPLVAAATASAQGSTIQISDPTPAPGQTVTIRGNSFGGSAAGNIDVRLDTRNGPSLVQPTADPSGNISATFPLPANLTPGWHLLVVTQLINANGRHKNFTPGRVRINVGAARAAGGATGGGGGLPGSPPWFLALTAVLVLVATGATLTVRRLRTPTRHYVGR